MDNPDQNMETPNAAPVAEEAKQDAAYGSILGIILIVAVLVVGAFYVWNERLSADEPTMPENGVRGEVLPDDSMPSTEGSASIELGSEEPMPE